jgi:STE24 endopeptidase
VNEDKAARYHRLHRRAIVASLAWSTVLLAGLVVSGWHARLRDVAELVLPRSPVPVYVALLLILHEIVGFPLAAYSSVVLERRYGLSTEPVRVWVLDQVKSMGIALALGAGAASLIYAFIRRWPEQWWLPAGVAFAAFVVALTNVAPVLVLPLFYRVKPLEREDLRARLLALADRAGARVLGAYEWGLGAKTRKANAALAGLGGTRRILVSDTMLADYTEEEIEVVLAHELAHHVHGDIWKGIAFEVVLIVSGFYLAARALSSLSAAAGLRGVADIAGLPVLLLAAGVVSVLMSPVANAMSRAFERRADRFALGLTKNPSAFISAMRRLAQQNLAEEEPSRIVRWLFYSHPPMRERIAVAEVFASRGKPG